MEKKITENFHFYPCFVSSRLWGFGEPSSCSSLCPLMAQMVKNPCAVKETRVQSLDREDPLEKGMATHSGILAWRIPWTGGLVGCTTWGRKESDMTEWLNTIGYYRVLSRVPCVYSRSVLVLFVSFLSLFGCTRSFLQQVWSSSLKVKELVAQSCPILHYPRIIK